MENMEAENIVNRPPLREAGLCYSLSAVLSVLLSLLLSVVLLAAGGDVGGEDWFKYLTFLLTQVCFACVATLFFRRTGTSPKEFYRAPKWYYFPAAVLLQFGLLFSLNALNEYFVDFLSMLGYRPSLSDAVPALDGWNLLPAMLVIAVLPALFEETVFRGILFGGMRKGGWGAVPAVLLSGALFSLFHGNPEQTIYQFLCGAAFALLALKAGSILPGMLAHLLNNGLILVMTSLNLDLTALPVTGTIILYALSALSLAGSLAFLFIWDGPKDGIGQRGMKGGKLFFVTASVGIGICAIEWIYVLVTGFVS